MYIFISYILLIPILIPSMLQIMLLTLTASKFGDNLFINHQFSLVIFVLRFNRSKYQWSKSFEDIKSCNSLLYTKAKCLRYCQIYWTKSQIYLPSCNLCTQLYVSCSSDINLYMFYCIVAFIFTIQIYYMLIWFYWGYAFIFYRLINECEWS